MNKDGHQALQEAITNWKKIRRFTFENKQVHSFKSPISDGEFILTFSNSLRSFMCKDKTIDVTSDSGKFHTATLSDNPVSENFNGDKLRLEKFLEDFDNSFYTLVDQKLSECLDTLYTTDPLFF